MKAFIRTRIAEGDSEQKIKAALVAEFGEEVLAEPPGGGFGLLAWLLPLAALAVGAIAVAFLVWTWTRGRDPEVAGEARASHSIRRPSASSTRSSPGSTREQRSPPARVRGKSMFPPRAPFFTRAQGTSRLPAPLHAHGPTVVGP